LGGLQWVLVLLVEATFSLFKMR